MSDLTGEISAIAAELRAIAAFGLNFAGNPYDEERFQAVLNAAAHLQALVDGRPAADLLQLYRAKAFGLSAQPSAEAVVWNEDGRLLLVQRRDDGLWALPGGITDPGETLAASALRELREETGLRGSVERLLGLFDSRLWHSEKRLHFYHVLFEVAVGTAPLHPSAEVLAAAYFSAAELPPLSPGHHLRVPFAFAQRRGAAPVPYFDRPPAEDDDGN